MGVRKNAKFLTPAERENFVKACVLMKADIVNPAAPAADRYSRWDEAAAVHQMIQVANAPGVVGTVNYGHGGLGSYSFLSWHRYFLYRFELQLQSYVPGVMLPYWDWTNPSPLLTDTFLGPNGSPGTTVVSRGYFAPVKPGSPSNPTPLPGWWPASLAGWNLHAEFGTAAGPLTRNVGGSLPSVNDLRTSLARTTYSAFQNMLESGAGLLSGNQMHNGLHGYIGGHMSSPAVSPFDPIFYLHHCNIDRLWTMWQLDGHATLYPAAGANPQHGPNDAMYPWVGAAAPLYSNNAPFNAIVMPDTSAIGVVRNVDTLDYRAYGYTYDTLAVIGIGLDRTGSMTGLTPDPLTGSGTVTKWEAARRGVSAFLQDAETVQNSGAIYVTAGIKTFRSLAGNDFASVFPGTPYGLIKAGTAYSKGTFDGAVAGMTPFGGTPLADALQDVEDTLVEPPEGWIPSDEPRYLAMLTDGMLTSGSPMASIPDGSFANTAIFAMGFGTAADVDYATLAAMVAKGRTLPFSQVFHGENAGVIDKFYSNALARAIGFSTIFDPVLELFAGEHTHLEFTATSAEETFFLTAQGMDFTDPNWSFHLEAPDGTTLYADGAAHGHAGHTGSMSGMRLPDVTATRSDGRLSLVLQRDSADDSCWVGRWRLMIAYRARDLSAMTMFDPGELMIPVAAGPIRGPRHARLIQRPDRQFATRALTGVPHNRLDVRATGTNHSDAEACSIVVTIYARTRLRVELAPEREIAPRGESIKLVIDADVLSGDLVSTRGFARLVGPAVDLARAVRRVKAADVPRRARRRSVGEGRDDGRVDPALLLGYLERDDPKLSALVDQEVAVVRHDDGPLHLHIEETPTPGGWHLGVYVEGVYCADHGVAAGGHDHGAHADGAHDPASHDHASMDADTSAHGPDCRYERFTRLLNASVAAVGESAARKPKR
jgi:hypothetical protein